MNNEELICVRCNKEIKGHAICGLWNDNYEPMCQHCYWLPEMYLNKDDIRYRLAEVLTERFVEMINYYRFNIEHTDDLSPILIEEVVSIIKRIQRRKEVQ